MCDLVRHSADDAQQLAERRGSRIEFRLPATGCFAEVDRRRVERILRNILVNAVEHGEGKDVVVTTAIDSDAVAVSVRDYGVGLRPGEEQQVFDRFWRADPARARTTGGTGLGLAISLEDARLHGGWLQAWGERGKGSVFRLTLPRIAGQELAGSPLPLGPDEAEVTGLASAPAVAATRCRRRRRRRSPVASGVRPRRLGRMCRAGRRGRLGGGLCGHAASGPPGSTAAPQASAPAVNFIGPFPSDPSPAGTRPRSCRASCRPAPAIPTYTIAENYLAS